MYEEKTNFTNPDFTACFELSSLSRQISLVRSILREGSIEMLRESWAIIYFQSISFPREFRDYRNLEQIVQPIMKSSDFCKQ